MYRKRASKVVNLKDVHCYCSNRRQLEGQRWEEGQERREKSERVRMWSVGLDARDSECLGVELHKALQCGS